MDDFSIDAEFLSSLVGDLDIPLGCPTIDTTRLVLRMMDENDADALYAIGSDEQTAYWAGMHPFKSVDDALDNIDNANFFLNEPQFGITLKDSGKLIGVICIMMGYEGGREIPQVGYYLDSQYRKQGYMTEALLAICEYIFRTDDTDRVMLQIRPDNLPSRALAAKCGFLQDPSQKVWEKNIYGKPLDNFYLTREDYYTAHPETWE